MWSMPRCGGFAGILEIRKGPHQMSAPAGKNPRAGGSLLALSVIAGAIAGALLEQPSMGVGRRDRYRHRNLFGGLACRHQAGSKAAPQRGSRHFDTRRLTLRD